MASMKQIFSSIQYVLLLLSIAYLDTFYAATLSFSPSGTAIPDEFCLEQFSWNGNIVQSDSIPPYCDDIDNILTDYCGNTAFYASIDPNYNAVNANDECIFYFDDQQIISKTYVIDEIPINRITFSSKTTSHLILSQSFLSVLSYHGSINIVNLSFSSNSNMFSLVNIASRDIALDITLVSCHFTDMKADYGSIINIPNNDASAEYSNAISITFSNCIMERTYSQHGGILYIERNNVYVTLAQCDINDIGSIIHWLCQSSDNEDGLCGELSIHNTNIMGSNDDLFTIDLSIDPSQIQFVLNVDASVFMNIAGTIFNFNHNDDALAPSALRIQEQNAFIHINNSRFEDNGFKRGYTNNGTIFTINSVTVPDVTIENSNFRNNTASYGTIFYWYCSRNVRWIKDNYCGSITLRDNLFQQNKIELSPYFPRYGSLIYAQMRNNMQFDLWIDRSSFIQHSGNLIYLEESTAFLPHLDDFTQGNFSNYTVIDFTNGNASDYGDDEQYTPDTNVSVSWTSNTSAIDIMNLDSSFPMIFVEDSQFIECDGIVSTTANSNLFLYTFITRSLFEGNECNPDTEIFEGNACFNIFAGNIYITESVFDGSTSGISTTKSTTSAAETTSRTTSTMANTESTTLTTSATSAAGSTSSAASTTESATSSAESTSSITSTAESTASTTTQTTTTTVEDVNENGAVSKGYSVSVAIVIAVLELLH